MTSNNYANNIRKSLEIIKEGMDDEGMAHDLFHAKSKIYSHAKGDLLRQAVEKRKRAEGNHNPKDYKGSPKMEDHPHYTDDVTLFSLDEKGYDIFMEITTSNLNLDFWWADNDWLAMDEKDWSKVEPHIIDGGGKVRYYTGMEPNEIS